MFEEHGDDEIERVEIEDCEGTELESAKEETVHNDSGIDAIPDTSKTHSL